MISHYCYGQHYLASLHIHLEIATHQCLQYKAINGPSAVKHGVQFIILCLLLWRHIVELSDRQQS